jgi:hypothetical protein
MTAMLPKLARDRIRPYSMQQLRRQSLLNLITNVADNYRKIRMGSAPFLMKTL